MVDSVLLDKGLNEFFKNQKQICYLGNIKSLNNQLQMINEKVLDYLIVTNNLFPEFLNRYKDASFINNKPLQILLLAIYEHKKPNTFPIKENLPFKIKIICDLPFLSP